MKTCRRGFIDVGDAVLGKLLCFIVEILFGTSFVSFCCELLNVSLECCVYGICIGEKRWHVTSLLFSAFYRISDLFPLEI